MTQQTAFQRGLETIRKTAEANGLQVSVPEILAAFPGAELSEEEVTVINAFLEQEGIELKDYEPHDTYRISLNEAAAAFPEEAEDWSSEEEKRNYEWFLEELAQIPPLSREEEAVLYRALKAGSEAEKRGARERLSEGNTRWVVELAKKYTGRGVPLPDLVQEGSMAFLTVLDEVPEEEEERVAFLEKSIRESMKALVREQAGFDRAEERMAVEANRILETTKRLEEEEGRAVTAEELSRELGLPKERVEEVLRESAKAILNSRK